MKAAKREQEGVDWASAEDLNSFREYLRNCSDPQVRGVYAKERAAGRKVYADLARDEARDVRGFEVEEP